MVTGLIGILAKDGLECVAKLEGCKTRGEVWILCVIIVLRAAKTAPISVRVKPQVVK